MDCLDGASGNLKNFRKDDFETDWIKVSEGSCGQVYRVKVTLWREQCALKLIDPSRSPHSSYRGKLDEASQMAEVKFKYLVTIYGLCREPAALVMEYMGNGSLDNLLDTHTLMWAKKFQMIHEVTMAMNYLHSMKPALLHLNLKTSNVLVDDHLHIKVSDYGVIDWEQCLDQKKLMEHLLARGNISYIPPETVTQCPEPPGTTFDVYSYAIVMWEILTQQKPHPGSSVTTVLVQVSLGKRPSVDMLPEDKPHECDQMVGIMQQCWDQDHRRRPPFSASLYEHNWPVFGGGKPERRKVIFVTAGIPMGWADTCQQGVLWEEWDEGSICPPSGGSSLADTVKKTEVLSEVLKIPGAVSSHSSQEPQYPCMNSRAVPGLHDIPSGDQSDAAEGGILSLLSRKDFERFRQSLRRGHVFAAFPDDNTLLHYTVASGDAESVRRVLSLGAEVNRPSSKGYTPLIIAVLHRLHDMVPLLLQHGAGVAQGDDDQWTALHFAAQSGDDRSARMLLDGGAAADARERAGWTPLHLACQNGHEAAARVLLSRTPAGGAEAREETTGRTPLHVACAYGHDGIAKLLLARGADRDAADRALASPLHLAAERGRNTVVRRLVKSGAAVGGADARGLTPLHLAALSGHTGICRQLLSNGARPDPRTPQGWTPVHLAALRGHGDTLLQLDSQGCRVDARGLSGWTPLHLACHHGREGAVAKLLAAGADPDVAEDSAGWTPLHLACSGASFPSVLQLVSRGADVNATNWHGATPLHLAARRGCAPVVRALLLNGADRGLRDSAGATALDVARSHERTEVAELLLKD